MNMDMYGIFHKETTYSLKSASWETFKLAIGPFGIFVTIGEDSLTIAERLGYKPILSGPSEYGNVYNSSEYRRHTISLKAIQMHCNMAILKATKGI